MDSLKCPACRGRKKVIDKPWKPGRTWMPCPACQYDYGAVKVAVGREWDSRGDGVNLRAQRKPA